MVSSKYTSGTSLLHMGWKNYVTILGIYLVLLVAAGSNAPAMAKAVGEIS